MISRAGSPSGGSQSRVSAVIFLAALVCVCPQQVAYAGPSLRIQVTELEGELKFEATELRIEPASRGSDKAAAADFDGDGLDELVLATSDEKEGNGGFLGIWKLEGKVFRKVPTGWIAPQPAGTFLGVTDSDADGKPELMFSGKTDEPRFFEIRRPDGPPNRVLIPASASRKKLVDPGKLHSFPGLLFLTSEYSYFAFISGAPDKDGVGSLMLSRSYYTTGAHTLSGSGVLTWGSMSDPQSWELLQCVEIGGERFLARSRGARENTVIRDRSYAEFPSFVDCGTDLVGDFTGDGLSDVVRLSDGPLGDWGTVSWRNVSYEKQVTGITIPVGARARATGGHFLPGSQESIAFVAGSGAVQMFNARLAPVEGAQVKIAGRVAGSTDAAGMLGVDPLGEQSTPLVLEVDRGRNGRPFFLSNPERPFDEMLKHKLHGDGVLLVPGLHENRDGETGRHLFDVPRGEGSAVCLGYNPAARLSRRWGRSFEACPAGSAVVESDDSGGYGASMTCCQLPSREILVPGSEMEVPAESACPEDHVVTGVIRDERSENKGVTIRCTRIDTSRYMLGPAQRGIYWGEGMSMDRSAKHVFRTEVPVAVRAAIGRTGLGSWDVDGCIPPAFHSLLTENGGKSCEDKIFRELRYRGADGSSDAGKPVPMFPDCSKVRNIYDPLSGCVE